MLQTILKKLRQLTAAHVLAVLFLVYIFYVGLYAMPDFMYNIGRSLHWQTGINDLIDSVDAVYEDMLAAEKHLPLLHNKGTYVNLNGYMADLMDQPMMNERIKLKNGHLTHLVTDAMDPENIQQAADNVIRFHKTQTASGGNFLFVLTPNQISKYEDLLPEGYTDTTHATADAFLAMLNDAGVPCLDLREELQKDGISVTDAFFVTDHHWTPQTGLWAFGEILEKLTDMDAIEAVDPKYTDPGYYIFETYDDAFLGSAGRRTGTKFAGLDDAVLLRPEFETDISVILPEKDLSLRGAYEEVAYSTADEPDYEDPDFFKDNVYGLYGWGDTQITHWRNEGAAQQGNFLLIGESFGNIPFSLMSLVFGVCDEVDLRLYEGDFAGYYGSFRPKTVILEMNPDMIGSVFTNYPYPN